MGVECTLQFEMCRDAVRSSNHDNCDSVPRVGRSLRASCAFAAALGLSGCLLFTDPINKGPIVTIHPPSDAITRGIPAQFVASVDDEDSPSSLLLTWGEFDPKNGGCGWITAATWVSVRKESSPLDSYAPYLFTAQSLDQVCLCVRTTDHNGAMGLKCLVDPITPVNSPPVANIVDVAGVLSGQARSLCSQVHLSAEGSKVPEGDKLDFQWDVQNSTSDPSAKLPQLGPCTGVATGKADRHRCFSAGSPGTYTVTLKINDTYTVNGSTASTPSEVASFVVSVRGDTPPCLRRTDPDQYRQLILLSTGSDLGGTYESRTFTVLNVDDDCEPYPLPSGSTHSPTQFVWSVRDDTKASPTWTYQTNSSNAFTVSQAQFPNARPGDTIELRVEVRDSAVQKLYQSGGQVCPMDTTDFCCGSAPCGSTSECLRWTTWTVQFLP